jgi:O-antigen/teichoic acid export membrane protein
VSTVRRSLFLLLANNYYAVALQLISTLVISRLLTPVEIGIYAVAAVLGALAGQLRDFGLQEYLIQEKQLTHSRIRAAFGMNIITSWSMATLFLISSATVGEFYRQPGITDVMRIQCISFVLVPFGAITMAYFRREINYRPLLISGILSNTISFFVSITMVLNGFSYMSLAWSALAGVITSVTASMYFRPKSYPRWPSFRGLGEVFHFSKHAMGIYVFGQLGRSAPEAIIGRAVDVASVAFFSRANGMIEIFNRGVIRPTVEICLPYFSQTSRAGQEPRIGYLRATALLTGIGWPFFIAMGIIAYSAIRLLYGSQWAASVPLAQILCLVAIVELLYWLSTEVMIAEGRVDQSNRLQFIVQLLRLAGILLVFPFGLTGVCWGLLLASFAGAVISHRFLHRVIGLRFTDIVKACSPSALTAIFSSIPTIYIAGFIEQDSSNYLWVFFGSVLATAIAWVLAIKIFRHPFWDEICLLAAKFAKK